MTGTASRVPDIRAHLRERVGYSVYTLTGRENRILRVDGDTVWVGTDRSPEGRPVPILDIQDAAGRLYRDGDIEISVSSVGYRSAFVGRSPWVATRHEQADTTCLGDLAGSGGNAMKRTGSAEFGPAWAHESAVTMATESVQSTHHLAVRLQPPEPRPGSWLVGRLVLTDSAGSKKTPPPRGDLLALAFDELEMQRATVRYLLTPAGFVRLKLPPGHGLTHGWHTDRRDFASVVEIATNEVLRLASGDLLARARGVADYLVIGVDVVSPNNGGRPYGETAIVMDLRQAVVVGTTGKTFPNSEQQGHLIRNADAGSHVMRIGEDRLAVLVCHDLVAFGNRSATNRRGIRADVGQKLECALSACEPTVILHLPHTVDSASTWVPPWRRLLGRHGGSTVAWASAIKYRVVGDGHRPAKPLSPRLLVATAGGREGVLDIVVGDAPGI